MRRSETEQEKEVEAQGRHESEEKAQGGHESKVKAQGGQEEDVNSVHDQSHVSNRHMTWWQNAWWVRVDNGPHMRSAKGRRRTWRAARLAAEQVRSGNWVGETREGDGGGERQNRKNNEATPPPNPACRTATAGAPIKPTAAAATAAATAGNDVCSDAATMSCDDAVMVLKRICTTDADLNERFEDNVDAISNGDGSCDEWLAETAKLDCRTCSGWST